MGEGIQRLAAAIVLQAVTDYRHVLKELTKRHQKQKKLDLLAEKESIERFFRSDWYRTLSDVDGELVIREITKQCWPWWKKVLEKGQE